MIKEKNRIIILDEVENYNANKIIKKILVINNKDKKIKLVDASYEPEPIRLIINSFGGSIYDGLAIIGIIETSETPVHTFCYGSAMSMALYILISGHYRYCSKYSTLMYHELSTEVSDKMSNIENDLNECKRLDNICTQILLEKTKLKKKEIDTLRSKKNDWYFTAEYAKSKGLIDEII